MAEDVEADKPPTGIVSSLVCKVEGGAGSARERVRTGLAEDLPRARSTSRPAPANFQGDDSPRITITSDPVGPTGKIIKSLEKELAARSRLSALTLDSLSAAQVELGRERDRGDKLQHHVDNLEIDMKLALCALRIRSCSAEILDAPELTGDRSQSAVSEGTDQKADAQAGGEQLAAAARARLEERLSQTERQDWQRSPTSHAEHSELSLVELQHRLATEIAARECAERKATADGGSSQSVALAAAEVREAELERQLAMQATALQATAARMEGDGGNGLNAGLEARAVSLERQLAEETAMRQEAERRLTHSEETLKLNERRRTAELAGELALESQQMLPSVCAVPLPPDEDEHASPNPRPGRRLSSRTRSGSSPGSEARRLREVVAEGALERECLSKLLAEQAAEIAALRAVLDAQGRTLAWAPIPGASEAAKGSAAQRGRSFGAMASLFSRPMPPSA